MSQRAKPSERDNHDAGLIRLCAKFHLLNVVLAAWPHDDDEGFHAKLDERWGICDQIMALSAVTDAGRREKAAVALANLSENYLHDRGGRTIRTTIAALQDIAGRTAA